MPARPSARLPAWLVGRGCNIEDAAGRLYLAGNLLPIPPPSIFPRLVRPVDKLFHFDRSIGIPLF